MFSSWRASEFCCLIIIICSIQWNSTGSEVNDIFAHEIYTQDIVGGDIFFEIIDPVELEYTYRLRPAKDFGAPFNASFKAEKVALVAAEPADACSSLKNEYDVEGNVVLIERGECSFVTKAINAERAGARAAIITESNALSNEYDYYIEMVHDGSDRDTNIPAGFLLGKNSRVIRNTLRKLNKKYALINLPVNLTFTPPHLINHPPWLEW